MAETSSPVLVLEEIGKLWKKQWEGAKHKMLYKGRNKETQRLWHVQASSKGAEANYAIETTRAIKEQRRMKEILKTKPEKWGTGYIEGVEPKVLTDEEVRNWIGKGGPYATLIHEIRVLYRTLGFRGLEGLDVWRRVVLPLLKEAKKKPEKVPEIREKIITQLKAEAAKIVVPVPVI